MACRNITTVGDGPKGLDIPKSLLDMLDDAALKQLKSANGVSRRAHARYRYRHRDVRLILLLPGGAQTNHLVCTRNISVGGLALLHDKRVLQETRCRLILPSFDGRLHPLEAVVRSCRVAQGDICEIGVEFCDPVDVTAFIGMDTSARIRTG